MAESVLVYDKTEENCPEPCCALKAYAMYDKELKYTVYLVILWCDTVCLSILV